MRPEDYFDFEQFDTPFGKVERIRLKGHRIDLEHVLEYVKQGYSPQAIVDEVYSTLSVDKVLACIDYYRDHREKVDAYIAESDRIGEAYYQEHLKQLNPGRDRLVALQAAREKARGEQNGTP